MSTAVFPAESIDARVAALDWTAIRATLEAEGVANVGALLTPAERAQLIRGYSDDARYRSRVVMARHGFGRGEYRYFSYPLVPVVERLRQTVYPHLVPVANLWARALRLGREFPPHLDQMLERCSAAGQSRPTPLLLRYGPGDFNCLHQDLYGEHAFPFQLAVLLSAPGSDFTGGEFVLLEQRPRMQSRAHVVPLAAGEGVIFAVNSRPVLGTRGYYRTTLRHGVSTIRSGERLTLGVIFHDAQ